MKKSDESNNRLQEDSSVTVHGLRRFNKRQGTVGSNSSIIRNCQGIETLNRSGKVLDSWHSAEKDEEATYFWNSDDMGRTKNNNSFLRSIISNNYTSVAQGNCMNSSEAKHSCTTGPISQRMQKIIPCGYAPNRFPVTVTTVPRECWPKTCCANPFYAFSGTNTLPSARISSSSPSAIQPLPSTSSFNPLSASEQTVYLTSDDGCKSQTLPVGLLRRFENDASVRGVLGMEREKFSKFHLGSEIFHRKLSFSKRNGGRECTSGNGRQLHEGALDKKKEAVEDVKKKRGAFLIWSSGDKGIKNVRNKSSKGASSHEKPRMPKFLQSFCCCIRPEATIKAKRRTLHPAPSTSTPQSLITQVTKNPQNGTNLNGTSVSVNDSYSANDYDGTGEYVPIGCTATDLFWD
uniref:DUF4005 domain-containing protein n=1 Tax=Setaria digitata TaxID=48799 RepID=A0A915Q5J5_9BILA